MSAVRRTPLYALLAADLVSMTGTRMTALALPWFVLATTGSATRTGLVAFAELLPFVVACAAGGPLIDRLGARRVSIVADAGSAVFLAAVPLLHDRIGFAGLIGLIAVVGALRGFADTSKSVIFPRAVAHSGMDLTRATSLHDGLARLATLLGAPIGGVLIAVVDAPAVLLVDAGSFVVGALLVAALVRTTAAAPPAEREPYLRAMRAGLGFLRREPLIAAVALMILFTNLFDAAYTSVLLPLWASERGSPTLLGALFATFAVGAVLGNLVFTVVAPRAPRYALFTAGFLVGGAPRFLAVALADDWVVFAVSFAAGLGLAAVNPILGAVRYERVPEPMLARVSGLLVAFAWAGIPLGALLGGWLADTAGLRFTLLAAGGLYLLVTLAPLTHPVWRGLDERPAAPIPPPREPRRRATPSVDGRPR